MIGDRSAGVEKPTAPTMYRNKHPAGTRKATAAACLRGLVRIIGTAQRMSEVRKHCRSILYRSVGNTGACVHWIGALFIRIATIVHMVVYGN